MGGMGGSFKYNIMRYNFGSPTTGGGGYFKWHFGVHFIIVMCVTPLWYPLKEVRKKNFFELTIFLFVIILIG